MVTKNLIVVSTPKGLETVFYYTCFGSSVELCDLRLITLADERHYTRVYRVRLDDFGRISLILIFDKDNCLEEVLSDVLNNISYHDPT